MKEEGCGGGKSPPTGENESQLPSKGGRDEKEKKEPMDFRCLKERGNNA